MRDEAEPAERRWVVRHLVAGCSRCLAVTSKIWSLGDPPAAPGAPAAEAPRGRGRRARRQARRRDDPADAGRRIEDEREQAPRLAAELLAGSPADRAALLARLDSPASGIHVPGSNRLDRSNRTVEADPAGRPRHSEGAAVVPNAGGGSDAQGDGSTPTAPSPDSGGRSSSASPALSRRFFSPAVCEALLDRSREIAAGEPGLALQAADLALAIAERLDAAACGDTVVDGLRIRAWGHLAQARRLGDDLDGAEWALAVAEGLAAGLGGPGERTGADREALEARSGQLEPPLQPPRPRRPLRPLRIVALEPSEWAELLVFKAGLFADRGDLAGADRLLEHAADLFRAAAQPQRAGRTLVQQGLIRAEVGDREGAAELLRAGVGLLDPASDPGLVAANLYRLATLLRAIALEAGVPVPDSRGVEALRLVGRARALYRGLGDFAAAAHLSRLQGQIEGALGRLEDAEGTLLAAAAALAEHGLGREAALAQIELALVLVRQGRAGEIRQLGNETWPLLPARDKSWKWYSAVLVFQLLTAWAAACPAHPDHPRLLGELARYLAPPPPQPARPPQNRRRLGLVA